MHSLNPTPIDNYYQCYTEYDDDDDDNTIITSNLREKNCNISSGAGLEVIKKNIRSVDKDLSDRLVEPVASPEVAKQVSKVRTLSREAVA